VCVCIGINTLIDPLASQTYSTTPTVQVAGLSMASFSCAQRARDACVGEEEEERDAMMCGLGCRVMVVGG